jgi:hypothetical protein
LKAYLTQIPLEYFGGLEEVELQSILNYKVKSNHMSIVPQNVLFSEAKIKGRKKGSLNKKGKKSVLKPIQSDTRTKFNDILNDKSKKDDRYSDLGKLDWNKPKQAMSNTGKGIFGAGFIIKSTTICDERKVKNNRGKTY